MADVDLMYHLRVELARAIMLRLLYVVLYCMPSGRTRARRRASSRRPIAAALSIAAA